MIYHHLMADLRKLKSVVLGRPLISDLSRPSKMSSLHLAFLALMVQDEIERREAKKLMVRIEKASFEEQKTLEEFEFAFNPRSNAGLSLKLPCALRREEGACLNLRTGGRREDPPRTKHSVTRPAGGDTASSS